MMTVLNQPNRGYLDDWKNKYPLLGKLGDRPKEWLEEKGRGVAPVTSK